MINKEMQEIVDKVKAGELKIKAVKSEKSHSCDGCYFYDASYGYKCTGIEEALMLEDCTEQDKIYKIKEVVAVKEEETSKETVTINAGIKSGDELARRLMEGEVFWTKNHNKIWYDKEYNNPFRLDSAPISISWGKLSTFKKEVLISELTLEEKLEAGIHCYAFVSKTELSPDDTVEVLLARGFAITKLVGHSSEGYESIDEVTWRYANEVEVRFV